MDNKKIHICNTITEFHKMCNLPKPEHPLISLVDYGLVEYQTDGNEISWIQHFYSVGLKRDIQGKFRYGQLPYDFDEGVIAFVAPGQLINIIVEESEIKPSGWVLLIHPDFLWNTSLAKNIKKYDFFGYKVNEALFVSEKEENILSDLIQNIRREYHSNIDNFTQSIIISQIELLLNYFERFYRRQFITRKKGNHQILEKLERIMDEYFSETLVNKGLPTAHHLAEK